MGGQRISAIVQPVGGEKFSVDTQTDSGGRFRVCIDPRVGGSPSSPWEGRPAGRADRIYEVVCEVNDASALADVRSRRLYFDLRRPVHHVDTMLVEQRPELAVRPPVQGDRVDPIPAAAIATPPRAMRKPASPANGRSQR
jgi:hypothetical protein